MFRSVLQAKARVDRTDQKIARIRAQFCRSDESSTYCSASIEAEDGFYRNLTIFKLHHHCMDAHVANALDVYFIIRSWNPSHTHHDFKGRMWNLGMNSDREGSECFPHVFF